MLLCTWTNENENENENGEMGTSESFIEGKGGDGRNVFTIIFLLLTI